MPAFIMEGPRTLPSKNASNADNALNTPYHPLDLLSAPL